MLKSNLCLILLGLAAGAPLALAQDNSNPPPPPANADQAPAEGGGPARGQARMRKMLEHIKETLNLTDDQFTQLQNMYKSQAQQMRQIRQDDSLSDDDKRAKVRDLNQSFKAQVRGMLTADQQKIFDANPNLLGGHRPRRQPSDSDSSGAPPPPPPPANN